jgi:hypothetical protein
MGNVFANGREVSSKSMSGTSICEFPDVCFTPPQTPATPAGVPLPYPNTGMSSDTTDGSTTVQIGGKEVMLKNKSYFKKSSGDEAGCAPKKGLINSKNTGKVFFKSWSMDVIAEGENVVRHLDLTTHNHASEVANGPAPAPHSAGMANVPPDDEDTKKKCAHKNNKKKRTYVIYHAPIMKNGKPTGQWYVGRSQGPQGMDPIKIALKRKRGHHRPDIGQPIVACVTTSYAAIRGAEHKHQQYFESKGKSKAGSKKKGGTQIRAISPKHKRKNDYCECAKRTNGPTCGICASEELCS